MATINLTLNGREITVEYDDGMHFLEVLREKLGVTSAKDGCAPQGYCGCCTILVDGRPALACLLDPKRAEGRTVTTLEGLPEKQRQILAEAFVREGAVQCGFCTPGITVRAAALLERGQATDRERVVKSLAGHLCRCTGYSRIIDGMLSAGDAWADGGCGESKKPRRANFFGEDYGLERDPLAQAEVRPGGVGDAAPRQLGAEHVLGTKPYVADMTVEGLLHAAVVLSEHPRARVVSIDPAPAQRMCGVERVLLADDVPGVRHHGLIVRDWPLLVAEGEITRCVGDVLAVVVAQSQFAARQAAAAVVVDYEVLEPVSDMHAALEPGSAQVHESGNLLEVCAFSRGDVDQALAAAAHVIEETFTTQRIEHAFLEPEAALVVPSDGSVTVYSQGQGVHDDQRQIAAILDLEIDQVRVELITNGGGFGGKEDLSIQGHAALAAHLLGRPVRLVLTRDQSILIHPKRHPLELRYVVGADADGRLMAVRARIIGDTGAYASVGMKVLERAAGHCCGPYRVDNVDVEAKTVFTNNPPCGAMRGFGANQASFAIEGLLDRLAHKIGLDGWEIRSRNVLMPGDRFATGQLMTESCGIRQTLDAVKRAYREAPLAGIACGIKNTGIGNGMEDIGRVLIRVADGGRLEVLTGYTEMGQGLHTVLRQVVCHETGVSPEAITVATASDPEVVCGMTTASRATALCTAAGRLAGQKMAQALRSQSLEQLVGREFHGEHIVDFTTKPGAEVDEPVTHMAFGYATQVVILDDDGRLQKVVAAHDVGRAINPLSCAGQIEGSVHMGLGYALSEDLPCTGGYLDSTKLKDLGILRAGHTPEIEVILVEVSDGVGGYGSKGVGEIGLVPTAGAVAGALAAFDGRFRTTLPMIDAAAARPSLPASRRPAKV